MIQMNTTPEPALRRHFELTHIPLSLNNARELGGIKLADGRHVKRGLLLRTTRLFDATEEDLRLLRERYRLRLIFDMREREEYESAPDPKIPGAKWLHTPVIDFAYLREALSERPDKGEPAFDPETFDRDRLLPWMIEAAREGRRLGRSDLGIGGAYAGYLAGGVGRKSLGLFFHELAACEDGAALWHCHTGKDRTGIAAGLILDVLGADWDTILCDYEASNLCYSREIEEMERELRRRGAEEELLPSLCGIAGVHAAMLENAWAYMRRRWGGTESYLTQACGVSADELEELREKYIEA
ncbi:MAG: tyrosine-protein phosphatase [Oscillospiraceae bacterium]|nr:tyrosine-protein phosphatase [Oscillospiraceae bacterium]